METLHSLVLPVQDLIRQMGGPASRLFLASVLVLGGWLLAKAIRYAVVKALRAINFHVLTERSGLDAFLQQSGSQRDTTAVLGLLAYWLAILATLVLACDSLGLVHVSNLLGRITLFVPRLMLALLIVAGGAYFAGAINDSVVAYGKRMGLDEAAVLGRAARYVVLVFVVLIALEQLNIGANLIRNSFLIILSGLVFGLALAFGLGGQKWAADLIEHWRTAGGARRDGDTEQKH